MNYCEYCHAPMLDLVQVCPNCHREQPPYPPQLPGGGGKSYRGWAAILLSLAVFWIGVGVAMFIMQPTSNISAFIYGQPDAYVNGNNGQYLGEGAVHGSGFPLYPGYGYLAFFGILGIILLLYAVTSWNRGNRIDKANRMILQSLQRNGNGH